MSILNVDKIQPIGGGSTITVDATDIQATSATITASKFVGSGDLSVTGVSTFTGNIDANGDLDVDGHTELDNVNISGVTTFAGNIDANGDIDVDGHTNLDNVSIAGVTTSAGNIYADNYFANSGLTLNNNGNPSVNITSTSTTGSSRIHFGDPDSGVVGKIYYAHNGDYMHFNTAYGERLRITSAGKVLIGTTTPQGNANADDLVVSTSGHSGITIRSGTSHNSNLFFADGVSGGDEYRGWVDYKHNDNAMSFGTNAAERLRIDSNGRLLVSRSGLTASKNVGTKTGEIQVAASGNNAAITLINYANDASSPYLMLGKSRAGNTTGNTIVQADDRLGEIAFCGADGNDIDSFGAAIKAWVDGTPGNNDMPGRLVFYTTSDGASTSTERLRITSAGTLKFTGQNTSLETAGITHHTNNNLYIRGGTSGLVLGNHDNTNTIHISNSDYIKFETTDGSERLRIESGGEIRLLSANGNNSDTPGFTFRGGNGSQEANFARIHSRMVSNWGGQLQFKVKDDNGSLSDAYQTAMIMDHNGHVTKPNQPSCTLYAPHAGQQINTSGDNVPIGYSQVEHNTGMTVSNGGSSDSTRVNSRIQVPVAGRYLISSLMSGSLNSAAAVDANDGVIWYLRKNGGAYATHYDKMFAWDSLGSTTGQEFELNFTVVLSLAANDYLEVAYTNIHTNFNVNLDKGYFSVHLLS